MAGWVDRGICAHERYKKLMRVSIIFVHMEECVCVRGMTKKNKIRQIIVNSRLPKQFLLIKLTNTCETTH